VFVRVKRSGPGSHAREYLQIVESRRERGHVRQRVLATLGRRDQLVADGTLDQLLHSLARFSERLRVVERVRAGGMQAVAARAWGPALVFGRLWETPGLPEVLRTRAAGRRFEFDVERVAFALALQRLCAPGSDLQGAAWVRSVEGPGFDTLELQHFYRTVGWLAQVRAELELDLFWRDRDLFSQTLDLVFIDTTSTYLYRTEETSLRRRGYSRDHRPDLPQVVLCVAVDRQGWPVAWDILPGSTGDIPAFVALLARLRERFRLGRIIVVADRGMVSAETLALLEGHPTAPFDFIVGCKLRKQKEISEEVLARAGRYRTVADNLEVKEVVVDDHRDLVCRNPVEAKKDAAARERIVAKLEAALTHGPKAVLGNRALRGSCGSRRGRSASTGPRSSAMPGWMASSCSAPTRRWTRPTSPGRTRASGGSSAPSARPKARWRCGRSSIIGMTRRSATSWGASSPSAWRSISSVGSTNAASRWPGRT
jgi:Transposase DDE domain